MKISTIKIGLSNIMCILLAVCICVNDMRIDIGGKPYNVSNAVLIIFVLYGLTSVFLSGKIIIQKDEKLFLLYWAYSFAVSFITSMMYRLSMPIEYWYHITAFIIIVTYFRRNKFDEKIFWKTMYFLMIILVIILFFQELSLLITGDFVKFAANTQTQRVASIYSEPTHYNLTAVLVLSSCLFGLDTMEISEFKRIFSSVIISISIIITVSATGILYTAFIWCVWLLKYKKVGMKVLTAFLLGVVVLLISTQTDFLYRTYSHIAGTDMFGTISKQFRVYRGFDIYTKLTRRQQIFGCGGGQVKNIVRSQNIISRFDNIDTIHSDYASALSTVMIETGIVGSFIFILFLWSLINDRDKMSIWLLAMYILYIVSNEVIYTPQLMMVLFVLWRRKDYDYTGQV